MMQSLIISNVDSVVVDETNLASKQIAVRAYDAAKNQLCNLIINTISARPVTLRKPPTVVKVNGSATPVIVAAGSTVTATVANGPGNPGDWLGVYASAAPSDPGHLMSWKWLSTDDARSSVPPAPGVAAGTVHLVMAASSGQYEVRFFSSDSFNVIGKSAAITATGSAPAVPKTVALTPPTVTVPDNSPLGTSLSAISVTMSDGSAFSGSLSIAANNMVGLSGGKAVLTRALATSDDGAHSCVITATQGVGSASAPLNFTVAAAPARTLVLSLSPTAPQIPDNSPAGAVVATATVKYSDGTAPASFTLTSSDPSFLTTNGNQLVLARALTPADDTTASNPPHHVTITADDGRGASVTMRLFEAGA